MTAAEEQDKKELERDLFGEGEEPLSENQYRAIKCIVDERDDLRAALLPFAAAAGRPGRLLDCMTDSPLPDDAVLGLGVKVLAWKRSIELTGA